MSEIAFRVVKEWDVVKIRLSEESKKRRESLLSRGCCLGCEERLKDGETVKRGLHDTCYQAARRAIHSGRVTEHELIRQGKLLEPGPAGPKPSNKFTQELSGR